MKLLRVGQKGSEKPAALDKDGKIRDISSHIKDLNPDFLNFETFAKLQNADLSNLPGLVIQEPILSFEDNSGKFEKSALCSFAKVSKFKKSGFKSLT